MIEALRTAHGFDPEYDDGVDADTILSALHAAGFAVVPVEPTEKMLDKGMLSLWNTEADEVAKAYRAMIAAAKETGDEA
jgi:hypothetical protein